MTFLGGRFQNQLDTKAMEIAIRTDARQTAHEDECGRRYAETRDTLIQINKRMDERSVQNQQQHSENQNKLSSIQRIVYIGVGGGTVLAFLFSEPGHNFVQLLAGAH